MVECKKKLIPADRGTFKARLFKFGKNLSCPRGAGCWAIDLQPTITACKTDSQTLLHQSKQFFITSVKCMEETTVCKLHPNGRAVTGHIGDNSGTDASGRLPLRLCLQLKRLFIAVNQCPWRPFFGRLENLNDCEKSSRRLGGDPDSGKAPLLPALGIN